MGMALSIENELSPLSSAIELGDMRLVKSWKKIHGQDDWVGMLDPMDPLLRSELIRYGEMAQACYDAFNYDDYSIYCGSCKFGPDEFFESKSLGLSSPGYHVTRHIYATTNINRPNFFKTTIRPTMWSKKANWMGYITVSGDETSKRIGRRDITIAWRGTITKLEWMKDIQINLKPISHEKIPCPDLDVKVHSGFPDLYTDKDESCGFCKYSAREQICAEVYRLIEKYPNEELSITITGHSLGSALAILTAFDIVENMKPKGGTVPICVFSFSGPVVGNRAFKDRLEDHGVKVLRVVNKHDTVPKILEVLPLNYSHVGVELELDHKISPFLKDTKDLALSDNLEVHLHLLDGYHGTGRAALVNKSGDFLKEDYYPDPDYSHPVPTNWRQDENKDRVRNKQGRWVQLERPWMKDPPTDIHHLLKKIWMQPERPRISSAL